MKILAVSDEEKAIIYSPQIVQRFGDVDLIISCGDLPYYYLEFMISMLDKRLFYVKGNHAARVEYGVGGERTEPWGGVNLHRRVVRDDLGLLLAGIEGSLVYNFGPNQYTEAQMWTYVWGLVPRLLYNRLRYGRYLDIFVTHASPWKVHDLEERAHRGSKAFRWFDTVFKPAYHLHGHIHIYRPDTIVETLLGQTLVVNAFGYREIRWNPNQSRKAVSQMGKESVYDQWKH